MAKEARLKIIIDALNMAKGELGTLQKDLDGVEKSSKKGASGLDTLKSGLSTTKDVMAGVTAGAAAFAMTWKVAMDIGKEGAQLERTQQQFDKLSGSIGTTADALKNKLADASRGMVSNAEMIAGASKIMELGLAKDEDSVVRLSTVVNKLGWDMSTVILTFANQSTMRLDALGLSVTDVTARWNKFKKAGVEATQAFNLAVIEAGEAKIGLLGDQADSSVGSFQRLDAATKNLADSLKTQLAPQLANAAEAATLLLTWNDKLSTSLSQHEADVRKTADGYEAYITEMQRAYAATGKQVDAQGRLIETHMNADRMAMKVAGAQVVLSQTQWEMNRAIEETNRLYPREIDYGIRLAASLKTQTVSTQDLKVAQDALKNSMATLSLEMAGPISKEMDSYNEKQVDLAEKAAKIKAELEKLQKTQGAVAKSETKNVMSATELALAQAKVTAATDDLNHAQQGAKESGAEFALRVAQLKNEIADQTDKMGKANQSVTRYVDNGKRIAELKGEYDEVNLAISKNADAHDEATKRILFDLLSQRAAMDGLSSDEMKALNDIALEWGLVDRKTHDAVTGIDSALATLATSGNIDAFIGKIGGIEAAAQNANAAFQTMMSQQAGLHAGMGGSPVATPAGPSTPSGPIPQAGGGDWMVNRPTLFMAGEAGPERATFTPQRGGNNTHYQYNSTQQSTIIIDDHRTGALFLEMQRRDRQRTAARSMG